MRRQAFKIFQILAVYFIVNGLNAQTVPMELCGYQHEVEKIIKKKPNFLAWQNEWYKQAQIEYLELQSAKRKVTSDTEYYEIPVVFHVIYNTQAQNISQNLILSQFNELNLDFGKMNSDTSRIRAIFKPLAANVKIKFKLAEKDPAGNTTTGINRIQTSVTTFAKDISGDYNENMKSTADGGQDAWNPSKYLNIWICNLEYPNASSVVYGFATPPTGTPYWDPPYGATRDTTDGTTGLVLHYKIVGKNNPLAPAKYKEGNTATHEIGHYLGLRHVWGDASNPPVNGCNADDGIFDTPNARDKNYTCTNPNLNTCTDPTDDKPDMTENYMDYALDGCAAMFTKEQAHLMHYVLNNFRTGLPARKISYDTITDFSNTVVSVYPNPSAGHKNITILINNNDDELVFEVALIDSNGKQILSKKVSANVKDYFYIEPYASAMYFLIVSDSSGEIITKQKLLVYP